MDIGMDGYEVKRIGGAATRSVTPIRRSSARAAASGKRIRKLPIASQLA